ncbi:VPA1262 family protein [Marinobacter sp. R17]|uniref:VPA1262 family protein n=1 Tax=Marinobacter sp. R17 TaxID=2484250 RepID=UPI000F4B888D|nr:VPA1262 family protein [Marinobacter sp. R17]
MEQLIADARFHDLFHKNGQASAIQLWLLEFRYESETSIRWFYGRALQADHISSEWKGSLRGKFTTLPSGKRVRLLSFIAYVSADSLRKFTVSLVAGKTLFEASVDGVIRVGTDISDVFKAVGLGPEVCIRPTMHLPARDYYRSINQRLSPRDDISFDSSAVSPLDKSALLQKFEAKDLSSIFRMACNRLDAETGMAFTSQDSWRLGDFEILCAPTLNQSERAKYCLSAKSEHAELEIIEPFTHEPTELLVVFKAFSDGAIQSSHVATVKKDASFPATVKFNVCSFKEERATAMTLEVFARPDNSEEAFLCLQVGNLFVRTIHSNINVLSNTRVEGKFDWLKKQVPKHARKQLDAVNTLQRSSTESNSVIGGHKRDPWVGINRDIASSLGSLLPPRSTARFFPKLSDSKGMSRLDLVEWLRKVFADHKKAQIAWFDPFMEDVGVELLHRMGASQGDYLIFTSEKQSNNGEDSCTGEVARQQRIQNLLQRCQDWGRSSFGNVRLRVITLPHEKLHDRMILIRSPSGLPTAGYQLSNSIQMANENHPLLVTPIPADILPGVLDYMDGIVEGSEHQIIFDSDVKDGGKPQTATDDLSPIEMQHSGDVLAWWMGSKELRGLSGHNLTEALKDYDLLAGTHINDAELCEPPSDFWTKGFDLEPFHGMWDAMGMFLAHSRFGDELTIRGDAHLDSAFEQRLVQHLNPDREGGLPARKTSEPRVDLNVYFNQNLEDLLKLQQAPEQIFYYSPPTVGYGDYYAIAILWQKAPNALASWLSNQIKDWVKNNGGSRNLRSRRGALITTALRYICTYIHFGKTKPGIEALLATDCPINQWIGLNGVKVELIQGNPTEKALAPIESLPNRDRVIVLCWLIGKTISVWPDCQQNLVGRLTSSISEPMSDQYLQDLTNLIRGPLGTLYHPTPWIFETLLAPLIGKKIVNPYQVAKLWLEDLLTQWNSTLSSDKHLSFVTASDGEFINELAIVFGFLTDDEQVGLLPKIQQIFKKLARTIRTPMSTQVNFRANHRAQQVNAWIYALANRLNTFACLPAAGQLTLLMENCSKLMRRQSPDYRTTIGSEDLFEYAFDDPRQLRSHPLCKALENAIQK